MSDSFPLVNLRQTIDEQWDQSFVTENLTIPSSKVLKLREVPDDGSVNAKPVIPGYTDTITYPPSAGQFYVNYCTGYIEFNNDDIGDTIDISYWAKGSLVEAEDINYLNNKHIISNTSPSGYYGQQWFNTNNGLTYNYDIRDKWLSMDRHMITFGRQGLSNNMYLNYYAGNLPSISSGLRLMRDACITGFAAQIRDVGTCSFLIRKNNSATDVVQLDINTEYGNESDSLDVDLVKGDILQCYFASVVTNVHDPMIMIELAWK